MKLSPSLAFAGRSDLIVAGGFINPLGLIGRFMMNALVGF
jgi:hypothetical protein